MKDGDLDSLVLRTAEGLGHMPGLWRQSSTDYFKWDRYVHCLNCGKVSGYDQDRELLLFSHECRSKPYAWVKGSYDE